MLGIYFSGTGNSKYALEVFLREYDNNSVLFSIEDKSLIEYINSHDEIVFSYPVQYSAVPKILSDFRLRSQVGAIKGIGETRLNQIMEIIAGHLNIHKEE